MNTDLTIVITGLRSTVGALRVLLFDDEAQWLKDDGACYHEKHDITGAKITVVISDLPTKRDGKAIEYAVFAVHDLKNKGKLDTNFFGMPRDGMVCSNGAKGGPGGGPKFRAAKLDLSSIAGTIDMPMWYMFSPTTAEKSSMTVA